MESDIVKKLTSKNPADFEPAAKELVNNSNVVAFENLVEKSDFLFDFVKDNVCKRLLAAINKDNFQNLFNFLKIYSADYEDVIVSSIVKYADEDITDKMLDLLENGTDEEKTYCAKYFSYINDSLSIELLQNLCFSDFEPLARNCAEALGIMKDKISLETAYQKLNSEDDFEVISAVGFLVAYRAEDVLDKLFEIIKKSPAAENLSAEIPYIESFMTLLDNPKYKDETLFAINNIINGFGDIIQLSQIFDFEMFDVFKKLSYEKTSKAAVLLLNAKLKFEQLTENDEYLFDEDKNTKQEVKEVSNLLKSFGDDFWNEQKGLIAEELNGESLFAQTALQIIQEMQLSQYFEAIKTLFNGTNQTLILKATEVLKTLNLLNQIKEQDVLKNISNRDIEGIIKAHFSNN